MAKTSIADITHPRYDLRYKEWRKWRLAYRGGHQFLTQYLQQFSSREDPNDFALRQNMSYVPSFAKTAIDEVKNSIFQRMSDISRTGGSDNFRLACAGLNRGVDLIGSSMNSFIGQKVLIELLVMGRVGIYVDMPPLQGETILDVGEKRPYIYMYETEDIRSWTYDDTGSPNEFGSLLLRDYVYEYDSESGLPKGQTTRYRRFWLEDGEVLMQFYDDSGAMLGYQDPTDLEPIRMGIARIPFVVLEIEDSLMTDLANYQIALMNLASSDLMYVLKANFPFYVEQFDPRAAASYLRAPSQGPVLTTNSKGNQLVPSSNTTAPGTQIDASTGKEQEIKVGVTRGRKYPTGSNQPAFINPSSEPLVASMAKQEQMKQEIRLLVSLAITNLSTAASSAEAKGFDERSLESGLSALGLILETGERLIADYWSAYEGKEPAMIKYPEKYNLKSDDDRRKEATETAKLATATPSQTYQKEMSKRVARIMLGSRLSEEKLIQIEKEIDDAAGINSDPDSITQDLTNGVVDLATASKLRGYPPTAVESAKKDHADRLARIVASQVSGKSDSGSDPGARGNKDASADPKAGAKEKENSRTVDDKGVPEPAVRGPAK